MKNLVKAIRTITAEPQYTPNLSRVRSVFLTLLFISLALCVVGCGHQTSSAAINDLKEAQDAFNQNNYDQTIAAASRAITRENAADAKPNAYYLIGRSLESRPKPSKDQSMKDLRDAWMNYLQALKENPSQPLAANIRTSLGNVAYWMEDFGTADQQWNIAWSLMDDSETRYWVLYRRGLCNQRLGNWELADKIYATVRDSAPESEAAKRAATKIGARNFHVQVGAFEKDSTASALATRLRTLGLPALISQSGNLYRVYVGPYAKYNDVVKAQGRLPGDIKDSVIVP